MPSKGLAGNEKGVVCMDGYYLMSLLFAKNSSPKTLQNVLLRKKLAQCHHHTDDSDG